MKRRVPERREWNPPPQPFTGPGEKRPQHFQDEDEPRSSVRGTEREAHADAFSRWLAHLEAGRIGD